MAAAEISNTSGADLAGSFFVVDSFLDDLVAGYESNPLRSRLAFRELLAEQPEEFLRSALTLFERGMHPAPADAIARLLLANDMALSALSDPAICTLPESIALARACVLIEPALDVMLMKRVWSTVGSAPPQVISRVLELISQISDGVRVMAPLMQLMRDTNPRIRSKVTLLIGRAKREVRWLETYLKDPEPRIRANAVEALWGEKSNEALRVFRAATQDSNHRVVANGCVGLYLAGDEEASLQLEQMTSFSEPMFRAAACWAMGRCGDRSFLPVVREMSSSKESVVRRSALRALVELRKRNPEPPGPSRRAAIMAPAAG